MGLGVRKAAGDGGAPAVSPRFVVERCPGCQSVKEGDGSWRALENWEQETLRTEESIKVTDSSCPDCLRIFREQLQEMQRLALQT